MEVVTKIIENVEELDAIDLNTIQFYRCGSADDGISLFCKKDDQVICYSDKEVIPYEKQVEFTQKLNALPNFEIVGLGMGHFLRMREEYLEEFNKKILSFVNMYRGSRETILEILSK